MIAAIPSAVLTGVDGQQVSVEVHVSNGLPGFTVVGLPDAAVRESRDRVRAALLSSGLPWPLRRVTVNLAPSGVRKSGAGLDLPIAIGLLVASGELEPEAVAGMAFVGELGLDGSLRGVPGVMVLAEALSAFQVVVAEESVPEARLATGSDLGSDLGPDHGSVVYSAPTLTVLAECLRGRRPWRETSPAPAGPIDPAGPLHAGGRSVAVGLGAGRVGAARVGAARVHSGGEPPTGLDLAEVLGQRLACRALAVAAAGGHHLLMVGPPGSGKTMLARRLTDLLPPLDRPTALEVTRIHSVAGLALPPGGLIEWPPFRAPHHGTSPVAMVGGGSGRMRPGEISMAHGGVLFLDELGEFPVAVLDALRQPLEDGVVRVSRARGTVTFPARFTLVAAMNPCPCGLGGGPGRCRCSRSSRDRYARRLSAPFLDRFDMAIRVDRPDPGELVGAEDLMAMEVDASARVGETTEVVAARVLAARHRAARRGVSVNADLDGSTLEEWAPMTPGAKALVARRIRAGTLSARGLHRVQRVARTIADLDAIADLDLDPDPDRPAGPIEEAHVREALLLRCRIGDLLAGDPEDGGR